MNKSTEADQQIINNATKQLAERLEGSAEYEDLQEARKMLENNQESLRLFEEYQKTIEMQQQMGGVVGDGTLEDLEEKVGSDLKIQKYIAAEKEWGGLLNDFFEQCSRNLEFDFLSVLGGCC